MTLSRDAKIRYDSFIHGQGWKIFYDFNAAPGAGDGTSQNPYGTLSDGFGDLRSGKHDVLFVEGADSGLAPSSPLIKVSKSDIAVIGTRGLNIQQPTGPKKVILSVTLPVRLSATSVRVTVGAGHGYSVGDFCLIVCTPQASSNYLTGPRRITATTSTTITFGCLAGDAAAQPFILDGAPFIVTWVTPVAIAFSNCKNVLLHGINVEGDLLADAWSGIVFEDGGSGLGNRDILISNCRIGRGFIGFMGDSTTPIFLQPGVNLRFENCEIGPSLVAAHVTPQFGFHGNVYYDAVVDLSLVNCTYKASVVAPLTVYDLTHGMVCSYQEDPITGAILANNRYPIETGVRGITRESLFISLKEQQQGTGTRTFARRNRFVGVDLITDGPVTMDDEGFLLDPEPQTFFGTDELPHHFDLDVEAVRQIGIETAAIDGRLPTDPADESLQQAAHAQTQADIAALNDPSATDNAAAVWDAVMTSFQTAGSMGRGLSRLHGGNVRTKLFFSDSEISTGPRFVPVNAVSHIEIDTRAEGGSFPGIVYYVVATYKAGSTAASATASTSVQATAPTDGTTYTSVAFP